MDIRETVKKTLNESNLTNPSKLYTPFTLFAVYFAIYFKADTLGRIFLSDDWAVTEKALADLKNPGLIEWFTFAGEVTLYSLGMLALYGLAQIAAVSIWSVSNMVNTRISATIDRLSYVHNSELKKVEDELKRANEREKEQSEVINSYHDWTPERVRQLKFDSDSAKSENSRLGTTIINRDNEIENLTKYCDEITSENENLKNKYKIELTSKEEIETSLLVSEAKKIFFEGRCQAEEALRKSPIQRNNISEGLEEGIAKLKVKDDVLRFLNTDSKSVTNSSIKMAHGKIFTLMQYFNLGRPSCSSSESEFKVEIQLSPVDIHKIRTSLGM